MRLSMIDRGAFPIRLRKCARPESCLPQRGTCSSKGLRSDPNGRDRQAGRRVQGNAVRLLRHKERLFTDLIAERFFCKFPLEVDQSLDPRSGTELLHSVVAAWRPVFIEGRVRKMGCASTKALRMLRGRAEAVNGARAWVDGPPAMSGLSLTHPKVDGSGNEPFDGEQSG